MNKPDKLTLLKKFIDHDIDDSDMKFLFRVINSEKGEQEIGQSLEEHYHETNVCTEVEVNSSELFNRIKAGIHKKKPRRARLKSIFFSKYAAFALILVGIGSFFITHVSKKSASYDDEFQTVVVAERGQISKVLLPDSSIVWLNSDSKITYNSLFGKKHRDICLVGQAFFDVSRNERLPFVVSCGNLNVNVLGTRFDVEAFPDQKKVRVILESGSVDLAHDNIPTFKYSMQPGELAEYDTAGHDLTLKQVNLKQQLAWMQGKLIFKEESLVKVFERLARKYNVAFDYKISEIEQSLFTATITDESLAEVLSLIEITSRVQCTYIKNEEGVITQVRVKH